MDSKQKEVIVYSTQIMNFLEEIVGGANHEVNNLLFIISMSTELLEHSNSKEERAKALKNIETQAERIGQIFKDLRSVIKDCGTEEVKLTKMSDVSGHVIELCKTRFNNHKIIFRNNVPDDIFIEARETQLTQALLAILNSSHDALVKTKSISKWIDFDVDTSTDQLKMTITDSSSKISENDIPKLFSPSFEAQGRKGLPLVIAKNIIESHGGEIVYDKESESNRFVITFSKYKKAEAQKAVARAYLKVV